MKPWEREMKSIFLSFGITLMLSSTSYAQKKMPYEGSWACSSVIESTYVDLQKVQPVMINQTRIDDVKFTAKEIKRNVFLVSRSDRVAQQFTILGAMVMLIDNSEQTQVCLRQED